MKKTYRNLILLSIVVISLLQHYPHFKKELVSFHVWRQTQTQSTIINFYEEDMNILNPRRNDRGDGDGIFRMEFPLMQWMVAALYKLFGNHLIISRIFMFIVGLFSVFGMYKMLFALFRKETLAIIGAWAFNFSPSFYYYTINPLPDNLALCFSIWGMALFFQWYRNKKVVSLLLSGLLLSLGALCKLPFILYFIVPFCWFVLDAYKNGFKLKQLLDAMAVLGFSVLSFAWYLTVIPQWQGNGIVSGVLDNTVPINTYLDYLQFNLISTIPELLINYGSMLFFLAGFYFFFRNRAYKKTLFPVMVIWGIALIAYLLFELNMIKKVHDYYLFPFYPLLFMLVSYGAYHLYQQKAKFFKYLTIFLLLILPLTCFLRMQHRWDTELPGFNKDLLFYKTELRDAVPKDALVVAGNDESHFIFFYYIDKKGWGFHNDELNALQLREMIDRGAEYLYCDSRSIDENDQTRKLLGEIILQKESIKIYKLKKSVSIR